VRILLALDRPLRAGILQFFTLFSKAGSNAAIPGAL
jgi:hypothetical protein